MKKRFKIKHLLPLCCLLIIGTACSKSSDPVPVPPVDPIPTVTFLASLPSNLSECSGVEIEADGSFLSHNDRGNEAEIYNFEKGGTLSKTYIFENITNVDWEDLTRDEDGNLYIGDFGNNDNDREDLVIYKVQKEELDQSTNITNVEKIFFNFEDQVSFPPSNNKMLFDTETMFYQNDFLYLLIKDRSSPFSGITRLYRLPNIAGNHSAIFQGEFITENNKDKGQVTSADLNQDGSVLAMLSNEMIWLFSGFSEGQYFSGTETKIDLPSGIQFEGIVFQDNCTLFLTSETTSGEEASLYQVDLCD